MTLRHMSGSFGILAAMDMGLVEVLELLSGRLIVDAGLSNALSAGMSIGLSVATKEITSTGKTLKKLLRLLAND